MYNNSIHSSSAQPVGAARGVHQLPNTQGRDVPSPGRLAGDPIVPDGTTATAANTTYSATADKPAPAPETKALRALRADTDEDDPGFRTLAQKLKVSGILADLRAWVTSAGLPMDDACFAETRSCLADASMRGEKDKPGERALSASAILNWLARESDNKRSKINTQDLQAAADMLEEIVSGARRAGAQDSPPLNLGPVASKLVDRIRQPGQAESLRNATSPPEVCDILLRLLDDAAEESCREQGVPLIHGHQRPQLRTACSDVLRAADWVTTHVGGKGALAADTFMRGMELFKKTVGTLDGSEADLFYSFYVDCVSQQPATFEACQAILNTSLVGRFGRNSGTDARQMVERNQIRALEAGDKVRPLLLQPESRVAMGEAIQALIGLFESRFQDGQAQRDA